MATLATLKARIQAEMDTVDEDFIDADELTNYINAGIDAAEALILKLNEDYFLAPKATITLVNGTQSYSLPTGIYAHKLRRVIYDNGSNKYEVKKIRDLTDTAFAQTGEPYRHVVTNDSTNGAKIYLYPTPNENGAYISVWYLRGANALSVSADTLDLPEAVNFIVQYAKDKCKYKETFTMDADWSPALQREAQLLVETLADRFPDEDNEIEAETSFYEEHS